MAARFSTDWLQVTEPVPYVYHVQLSRKPVNAFTVEFWKEYGQLFDSLSESETDIRAIVLSSSIPKIFSAGIDLQSLGTAASSAQIDAARTALVHNKLIREFQVAIGAPSRCPVPVIAAVHGPVIGLGIDIICACDVRYSASNATFCIKEADVGLAADIGTLAYLPKVCGNLSLVREYAYSARSFEPAVAEKMGFISTTVAGGKEEVVAAALMLASEIASKSPIAVSGTKRLISHAVDHSIAENLEYTSLWNSAALQTNDMPAVFASLQSKKPPVFSALRKPAPKL